MDYKIEKNVPITNYRRGLKTSYPLEKMEINDSFIADNEYTAKKHSSIMSRIIYWCFKNQSKSRFIVRKTEDNKIRVWRIE